MTEAGRAADWKAKADTPEYAAIRRRVAAAADEIVREQGIGALRLDSVADRAGLHRSSIYRYFDSKEELVTAVAVRASLRLGRRVIDRLGDDAPPERFFVEGLVIALSELAEDPVLRSLMAPTSSEAMARVGGRALTEGIRPLVEPVFADAERLGILRPGVAPDDALRWLQIVAVGLLRAPGIPAERDDLAALLEQMLVPALFARP